LTLPFIPPPLPDEILGSWLYRIRLHNHPVSFKAFTRQFMANNIVESGWRDISIYNQSLDDILRTLGTSFDESLIRLTTYPYWLRFHSESSYSSDNFNVAATAPKLVLNRIKNKASRFSYLRSNVIRVCPQCLAENLELFGEPYLHRAHHLPFVNVCYKHHIELISKCRSCGIGFHANKTFINANLICSCGSDLRQFITPKETHADAWIRLAKFSADALMDNSNIPTCIDYFNFFNANLSKMRIINRNDILDLLAVNFGIDNAKSLLTISPQSSDEYQFSAIGSVSINELRAPQFCAFFAATKLSYQVMNYQFTSYQNNKSNTNLENIQQPKTNKTPMSVKEARGYVLNLEREHSNTSIRSLIYKRYKTLFWYLTLFDKDWFENKHPHGGRGATKQIPAIIEDRDSIQNAIERSSRPRVTIWKNLAQQAYFRASLRDAEWLEIKKQKTIEEARNKLKYDRLSKFEVIEQELISATTYFYENTKHIRLTLKSIAPHTSFKLNQLRYLVAKYPSLEKYVSETWVEFKSRAKQL